MNRRTFLAGLLALPFAPAIASWVSRLPATGPLRFGRTSDIIAHTIEQRSQDIADYVSRTNPFLRHLNQPRAYHIGDEVALQGGRRLVCTRAGSSVPHKLKLVTSSALDGSSWFNYYADWAHGFATFEENAAETLQRRLRHEQRRQWASRASAWPFDNGV